MRQQKEISYSALKEVVGALLQGQEQGARGLVEERGLFLVNDEGAIREFVRDILEGNEKVVKKWGSTTSDKKRGKQVQALIVAANKDPRVERLDMAVFAGILAEMLEKTKDI